MKKFLVIALILLFIVMLGACDIFSDHVSSAEGTMVAHTQTAAMWTPAPITPTLTPIPKQAVIVNAFNDALRGADHLEEALDAKFAVTDIGFDLSGNPPIATTMRVQVECEWISRSSCTQERTFVALANAFKGVKPGIRKKIIGQVPDTIKFVHVIAFDHMNQIGIIEIEWKHLLDFANGDITGEQLASRILRFPPPP